MKKKRELGGLLFATKIALGGALGFEIFAYLGLSYIQAGSAVIYALLISGVLNLLTMFSYSELSAVLPEEGAEYTYARAAFGGFAGFTAGCIRWLSSVIGGALAAQIFTEQLDHFFKLSTNGEMSLCSFLTARFPLLEFASPHVMLIIATILIATLTILSIRGTKKFDTLIICLIVGVFSLFIVMGFLRASGGTLGEVDPHPELSAMPSFLLATAFMLQPFLGMRCVAASVPKIKEPEKNVPRAIALSTVILILLYFGAAYVSVSTLNSYNYTSNVENYSLALFNQTFNAENSSLLLPTVGNMTIPSVGGIPIGGLVMTFVGMVVCISGVSASLVVQGSILCGMSKDRYLPKALSSTHANSGTHHVAIVTSMLFMILFAVLGFTLEINFLAYSTALLNILVFALVNLSVIGLRRSYPHLVRPFKSPLYPLAPITGIMASLGLLVSTAVRILQKSGEGTVDVSFVLIAFGVLLGLVFLAYYLRMVGGDRLRAALGGISLGLGAAGVVSCYVVFSYPDWPFGDAISRFSVFLALVFMSVICLVAGIFNICSSRKCLSSRIVVDRGENSLIKDTIKEEMLSVHRIARNIGRRLSGLVIIVGILLLLLSLWSLVTSESFFNLFGTAVLGLASVVNIICGSLLLEK